MHRFLATGRWTSAEQASGGTVGVASAWRANIYMFGPLQIESGMGCLESRSFGGRKPRQLLIHLILARGKLLTIEELTTMLWAKDQPPDCGATLQHYVSVLRRQLRRGAPWLGDLILTERGGYRANPDLFWLDLAAFEAAGRTCSPDGDRGAMTHSLALYRGDVLEGEAEEPWLVTLRHHYRRMHVRIVIAAAAAALSWGDATGALALASTAAVREPGSEQAACLLMAARVVTGDVASALKAFDECERHLAESFGADPLPHTRRLRDAVMRRVGADAVVSLALSNGPPGRRLSSNVGVHRPLLRA